jgi:hypothetical protein
MRTICERVWRDDDWQLIAHEELRDTIPIHDDDLAEVNEIIAEAETRVANSEACK